MGESFYSSLLLDSRARDLVFFLPMYNDEDWKDDLREKKRLSDEETHKNKKSWKKLSFLALSVIAVIGVFKG